MRRRSLQPTDHSPSLAETIVAPRSRRVASPVEDDASWRSITFGDFVLIILCFFVLRHIVERQDLLAQGKHTASAPAVLHNDVVPTQSSTPVQPDVHVTKVVQEESPIILPSAVSMPSLAPQPEFIAIQPSPSATGQEEEVIPIIDALTPVPILTPLAPVVADPAVDTNWQMLADQIEQYLDKQELKDVAGTVSSQH